MGLSGQRLIVSTLHPGLANRIRKQALLSLQLINEKTQLVSH